MSATYLLPCHSGKTVEVTVANAGRTVVCPCGKQVDVPTLRELKKLPLAEVDAAAGKSTASNWTLQQGVFFSLGLLLIMAAAVAVIVLGYYRWQINTTKPEFREEYLAGMDKRVMDQTAAQTLPMWDLFNQPLPPKERRRPPLFEQYREAARQLYQYMGIAGLVALVGLGLSAFGIWAKPRPRKKPRRPT